MACSIDSDIVNGILYCWCCDGYCCWDFVGSIGEMGGGINEKNRVV